MLTKIEDQSRRDCKAFGSFLIRARTVFPGESLLPSFQEL
jgi:hypothetical protein